MCIHICMRVRSLAIAACMNDILRRSTLCRSRISLRCCGPMPANIRRGQMAVALAVVAGRLRVCARPAAPSCAIAVVASWSSLTLVDQHKVDHNHERLPDLWRGGFAYTMLLDALRRHVLGESPILPASAPGQNRPQPAPARCRSRRRDNEALVTDTRPAKDQVGATPWSCPPSTGGALRAAPSPVLLEPPSQMCRPTRGRRPASKTRGAAKLMRRGPQLRSTSACDRNNGDLPPRPLSRSKPTLCVARTRRIL